MREWRGQECSLFCTTSCSCTVACMGNCNSATSFSLSWPAPSCAMAKTKVSKGKGSSGRREEKRKKRFVSGPSSGGAKANVLREKEEGGAAGGAKRKREDGSGAAAPRKTYKQGTFARPVSVRREPPPAAPADPLSKKDLKVLAEARKATKKPNYALVQARGPTSRQPELCTACSHSRRLACAVLTQAHAPFLTHSPTEPHPGADRDVGEAAAAHRQRRGAFQVDGARSAPQSAKLQLTLCASSGGAGR